MAIEKTEVRIVSGTLRGRKLAVVVHPGLRPTPQMVREALFSILGNAVPGRVFFDVFAGSGVIGLEAVSRGATRAVLIERDARQVQDLQKSVDRFEVADRVQVLRADGYRWAERWVPPMGGPINVFFSPPFPDLQPDRLPAFLQMINEVWAKLPNESVLVIQGEDVFPLDQLPDGPDVWDIRKYGRNLLLFRVKGDLIESQPTDPADNPATA